MGTPAYAAPEQFDEERGHATPASDQYALATMAHQWLTGRLPFEGGSFVALATQKVLKDPPPLGEGVPPAAAAAVLRGLAKDPRARYPSVRAFAEALLAARQAPAGTSPAPAPQPAAPVELPSAPVAQPAPPMGTLLLTWKEHTSVVYTVAWSPDGRRLASAGNDKTVRVWWAGEGMSRASLASDG